VSSRREQSRYARLDPDAIAASYRRRSLIDRALVIALGLD
jgi:hypothetical protein